MADAANSQTQSDTKPDTEDHNNLGVTDEELNLLSAERDLTGETTQLQMQRMFQEAGPGAVRNIVRLARFSRDERIQHQASTYIVERVLGRVQDNPPAQVDNPYDKLVAEVVTFVEDHRPSGDTDQTEGDISGN